MNESFILHPSTFVSGSSTSGDFLLPAMSAGEHQSAEQLNVQAGCGRRSGMPLHTEGEPVAFRLDGLDDAVQSLSTKIETAQRAARRGDARC